ncbi:MAG: dihydrofolate reductase [Clostridia bacterium]|nr:dihydrofolate reductase [Clostridia bacterium]
MNLIVAADKNWGIGAKNTLLYNFKQDMNFFKEMTMDKVVVMGRNTLESFPGGKPLKRRINVCLNAEEGFERENVIVVTSLDQLFEKLAFYESDNIFVIGGASIYKQLLPYCKYAYVTKIEDSKEAEVFFPNLDKEKGWVLAKTGDPLYEDNTVFYFCKYENKNVQKYNWAIKPDLF